MIRTRHLLAINHNPYFQPQAGADRYIRLLRGLIFPMASAGSFQDFDSLFASTGFPPYLNNGFNALPSIEFRQRL